MNRALLFSALCVASPALATGDHDWTDTAAFVCGSADTLVFVLNRNTTNGGMRPGRDEASWASVELATGRVVREAKKPLAAPPGCQTQATAPRVPYLFLESAVAPAISLKRKALALKVSGPEGAKVIAERPVPALWLHDTSSEEYPEELDLQPSAEVRGPKVTVFAFAYQALSCDPVLFVGVDSTALAAARAQLSNDLGLYLHRKGQHDQAVNWFQDSGLEIAHYNAACAYARLEQPELAVGELAKLRDTKRLAAKIAKDRDFDPIRSRPALTEFLRSLGRADGGG